MMYEDYSCEFLGLMDENIVRKEKISLHQLLWGQLKVKTRSKYAAVNPVSTFFKEKEKEEMAVNMYIGL